MAYEYQRICRLIGLKLGPKQHMAAKYLEARGLRFCIDFGKQNAVETTRYLWHRSSQPKPTLRSIGGR
jgi:hypothetical protein